MVKLILFFCLPLVTLQALGQSYRETVQDEARPILWQELYSAETPLSRKYRAEPWIHLVLDGDFYIELNTQTEPQLEVQGSRALMDQLNVYSLNGTLYVWLNKGFLGPRETGRLTVRLSVPRMEVLTAINGTRIEGKVASVLPQRWSFRSGARADLEVDVSSLDLVATWNSRVALGGVATEVFLRPKDNALLDFRDLRSNRLILSTRGRTQTWLGPVDSIEGTLNQTSALYLPSGSATRDLPALSAQGRIEILER